MEQQDQIPEEVRLRIIEAAEALYLESGHEKLPSVDAVRRRARCDMNSTNRVVRDWKRQLTTRVEPVATLVPEAVVKVFNEVVVSAWLTAQDLANTNLHAAQIAWERERADSDSVRNELSELWDNVTHDLADANERIAELSRAQEVTTEEKAALLEQIQVLTADVAKQAARADQSEARAEEIERRVIDLKNDLSAAHDETKAVRTELTSARSTHLAELNQLRAVSATEIESARSALAIHQGKTDEAINARDRLIEQLQEKLLEATELSQRAQGELAALTAETRALDGVAKEQRKNAAAEAHRMAERFTKLQGERDDAVRQFAHVSGQLEALERQCTNLMSQLKK
ncbi:hypothetical protein YA0783_24940 [Pseudomonas corrugata]|uniref:DNA-binding protein n=1 Tax=Pseudomonas corrugata TaxID=47879 RepID=UPI0018E63A7C|nr:DNA-binding protein [Pseudomonas corrugata]MBI6621539.1 hypothetical protein [Pseudomonas corrugata]MBI6694226.1 hypothetical protein [Pseudomonas corrugata]